MTKKQDKKTIIDDLVKNNIFKETERKGLETLSDEALGVIVTNAMSDEDEEEDVDMSSVTANEYLAAAPDHIKDQIRLASAEELTAATKKGAEGLQPTSNNGQQDVQQWINSCPPQFREMFGDMTQNHTAVKTQLIATITANSANIFTKEQLAAKTVGELRGIAALCTNGGTAPVPAVIPNQQYFGAGGVFTQNAAPAPTAGPGPTEGLELPTMNFDPAEHFKH